jgi:polysaccharide chain length determinant protein (PEP-CTERM system associated)
METLRELTGRYGGLAWRRRWWAVLAAWIICIAGWVGIAMLPDQFEANARVYIDADAFLTPLLKGIAVESSLQDELDLLQHMLLSRPNLDRIIAKTDLQLDATTPTDRERMVDVLAERIRVVAQTRNIFSITYRNTSRQLASDVVQAMLASFIENKAGDNRDEIDRASTFIDSQIAIYEQQLRTAEAKRAAFKKKYVDLLPGDSGSNRLEVARSQVQTLRGQLADAQARRTLLAEQLNQTQATIGSDGAPGDPHAQLREAEDKLRELKQVYTDAYPEVVTQQHLVDTLRSAPERPSPAASGSDHYRATSNPVYEQFRLQLVETDSQIQSLKRQIGDAQTERDRLEGIAKGVPELEAEYTNLNRDYDVVRRNYDELVARREGMRISDAAQKKASNIKLVIIDPPSVPRVPVAPNRTLLAIGVLLGGIGAGVGVVAAMIALDQSFHSLIELRAMSLPVIGSVSLAILPPTAMQRLRQLAMFGAATGLLLVALGGVLLHFSRPI